MDLLSRQALLLYFPFGSSTLFAANLLMWHVSKEKEQEEGAKEKEGCALTCWWCNGYQLMVKKPCYCDFSVIPPETTPRISINGWYSCWVADAGLSAPPLRTRRRKRKKKRSAWMGPSGWFMAFHAFHVISQFISCHLCSLPVACYAPGYVYMHVRIRTLHVQYLCGYGNTFRVVPK